MVGNDTDAPLGFYEGLELVVIQVVAVNGAELREGPDKDLCASRGKAGTCEASCERVPTRFEVLDAHIASQLAHVPWRHLAASSSPTRS